MILKKKFSYEVTNSLIISIISGLASVSEKIFVASYLFLITGFDIMFIPIAYSLKLADKSDGEMILIYSFPDCFTYD